MADQNITIKLTVDGTGTLKKATSDVEKLNKATDKSTASKKKTSKASEEVIKGQKGIHQSNLSSAKGFSKMNQMLEGGGGSSGLVAAYATLAANVFAATAAFNAFRGAAAFEQLGEGFTFMANQAGRTMDLVVDRLKEVSGEALSTEQALQGASLAISAGFSTDDLEKLTKVARGASLALGRNLADAFDRLTRGAIKLEPEILDELGIMVRLDDATEAYAATIGKTADQLTQFQRQTAFINAINEQGIEKYGELADAIDVNPYDKLAAAFSDLTHAGLGLINKVLIPFIEFFAGSQFGMTGAIILFSSTILTTMIPALGNMAKSAAGAAAQASKLAAAELDAVDARIVGAESELKVGTKRTKTVKDLQKTIEKGGDIEKQAKITQRNLTRQLTTAENNLKKVKKSGTVEQIAAAEARKLQIQQEITATTTLGTATQAQLTQRTVASAAALASTQALIISDNTLAISQVGIAAGFKIANTALKEYVAVSTAATITSTGLAGAFARTAIGAKIAAAAVRLFGTALLTALPGIGMVLLVVGGLVMAFSSLFSSAEDSKPLKALGKVTESLNEKFAQLNTTINNLGENASVGDIRIRQLKMSAGVLLEIAGSIEEINQEAERAKKLRVNQALEDIANTSSTTRIALGGVSSPEVQGERAKRRVQDEGFEPLKEALVGVAKDTSRASAELRKQLQIAFDEEMGEDSVLNAGGILKFIQQLRPAQFEQVADAVQKASSTTTAYDQALTNLKRSLSEGEQVFSKFFSKAAKTTEFDGIVDQFDTFEQSIDALKEKQGPALIAAFDGMGSQFRKFMTDVERGSGEKGIQSFINRVPGIGKAFKKLQKETQTLQVDLKKLNIEAASLKSISTISGKGMSAFLNKQNEAVQKQIDLNDLELATLRTLDETAEITDEINRLTTDNLGLTQKLKEESVIIMEAALVESQHKEKILKFQKEISKSKQDEALATAKIARLMSTGSAELNPAKQQRLLVAAAKKSTEFAIRENQLLNDRADIQNNLASNELAHKFAKDQIDETAYKESLRNLHQLMLLEMKRNDAKLDAIKAQNKLIEAQGMASGDLFTVAQTIKDMKDAGEQAAGVGVLVATAFAPMVEVFNELGTPEGGAIANAIERFSQLTITMMAFKETVKELKETLDSLSDNKNILGSLGISNEQLAKGLTAMAALGQAIGAIGALAAANAEMQVAAIDKQIAAEKKLDGNSKASLARIDAMEKKKIAIQKKAFETDKKIKIASAMIAGLTGAIMAYSAAQVIPPPAGQIIGAAMAAAVMALTAKNIALISATQFSGGAAAGGGIPQTISVGKRGSSIDTAMGATGGELAYLRGESGQGSNANNFIPGGAAGMRRGYNTGGEIMVGEQGPEVIQPTGSGYNVIPNDRLSGGSTTANFTINAIDAAGVEDVLTAQRGTIISMIQEAAHEHGEEFIESVNPQTYAGGEG